MKNIVTTEWLAENISAPDLVVLDASWHLPSAKRDAKSEFNAAHIPNARFFDLDANSDIASTLPHMLPTPANFASNMQKLGLENASRVVAYDATGLFSAARCWWMFKIFGHENVAVLDGGLPKWIAENRTTESGNPVLKATSSFGVKFNAAMAKSRSEVAQDLQFSAAQVADARSPTRFRGEEPEPRPGVRPGHMPKAANVHYAMLLNSDGTLKPKAELESQFHNAGIDIQKPVITSCGSGVTAAILSLALTELNAPAHALYDGSWADWGSSEMPVVLG